MNGAFVLTGIVLAWIISLFVGEYNSVLGEIFGMAMIQPLLVITILFMLLILYGGFRRIFNNEGSTKKIEKPTGNDFKKLSNPEDESDIYLKKNIVTNESIEYQIINEENAMLWTGICNLARGSIHSITLYSGYENKEMVLQVTEEIAGLDYLVKDNQSVIGSIKIIGNGLLFNNTNYVPVYTATLENVTEDGLGVVVDWVIALDTLQAFSSASESNYFTLKGECNETLGKYYMTLKNIDLTLDTNNNMDRRIAIIFSIFLDSVLNPNSGK